jgi:hypothetical protein
MKRLFVLTCSVLVVFSSATSSVSARSSADLDCSDFGTQERAQFEFEKRSSDRHGLDADDNGSACEWNPSPGYWGIATSGLGLLVGTYIGRRKRLGLAGVHPFPYGLVMEPISLREGKDVSGFDEGLLMFAAVFWGIPWFLTTLLRDHIYPITATPVLLLLTSFLIGGLITFVWNVTRERSLS